LPDPHLTKPALLIRRGAGTDLAASVSASSLSPATALLPDQSLQAEAYGYGRAVSDNRDVVVGLPEEGRGPAIGGNTSGGFPENERVLIIGGGAAGVSAAAAVRARNPVCDIIILSAEDQLSYSRPMLTKAALRGFDASAFTVFDEVWYLKHRIEFRKGISVAAIKPDSSEALLSDGSSISYDRCIIATGADCFIPPIPGRGLKRVFGIRDLKSTQAIRSALTTARKVVVIGGGVIGLEMAWEIKRAGCELTILELAPTLMGRLLDEQSAIDLADQLRRNGVVVRTGIKIEAIYAAATAGTGAPDDCVAGVRLADGTDFEADMVVVSCGIAPNTNLAKAVGCAVNRGILVNNYMETNVPGIYACGDCAEQENSSAGLWQTAVSQGSVAGAVAAGERKACLPEPAGLLMHGFGTCLYALGDAGKNPDLDYEVLECVNPDPKMFVVNDIQRQPGTARYFFVEDQLVGGVLMGNLLSMANLKKGIAEGLGRVGFKALKEGGG
jgi:NAD(P)H-nitrite reductase large subunit